MFAIILVAAAIVFVVYAAATQYSSTVATDSVPKRVWASVVAAGAAVGAAFMTWMHGVTGP